MGDIVILAVKSVAVWITGVRMRRRARRVLGRNISTQELASISMWMEVQDAEHRENPRTEPPLH